jgi:hypothetical protein
VGRSNIVGLPVALLLQNADATVTVVHSKTPNGEQLCSQADIVIAACGKAGMVDSRWIKEDAVVIDVGINAVDVRLRLPFSSVVFQEFPLFPLHGMSIAVVHVGDASRALVSVIVSHIVNQIACEARLVNTP